MIICFAVFGLVWIVSHETAQLFFTFFHLFFIEKLYYFLVHLQIDDCMPVNLLQINAF